jgi:hypothetical protein
MPALAGFAQNPYFSVTFVQKVILHKKSRQLNL